MYTPTSTPQPTQPKPVCYYYLDLKRGSHTIEPAQLSSRNFIDFLASCGLKPNQLVTPDLAEQLLVDLGTAGWDIRDERPPTRPICYSYLKHGSPVIEPDSASLDQFKLFLDSYRLTPGQGVTTEMMTQLPDDLEAAGWDIRLERPPTTAKTPVKPIEDIARRG